MTTVYKLLFFLGAVFLALFGFWMTMPTDYMAASYIGEAAAAVLCAAGITCLYVGYKIRQEWRAITQAALDAAREKAEASVRGELARLEAELAAARAYIAAMEARRGA